MHWKILLTEYLDQVKFFFTGQVVERLWSKKKYTAIRQATKARDNALKYVAERMSLGFEEAWQEREDEIIFLSQKSNFEVGQVSTEVADDSKFSTLNDRYLERRQAIDSMYQTEKQKIEDFYRNIKGQIETDYDYSKTLVENFLPIQSVVMLQAIEEYHYRHLEATRNVINTRQSARKGRYDKALLNSEDSGTAKASFLTAIEDEYDRQLSEIDQQYRNEILIAEEKLASVHVPSDRFFRGYEIKCSTYQQGLSTFTSIDLTTTHQENTIGTDLVRSKIVDFLNAISDLPDGLRGTITIHQDNQISYQQPGIERNKLYLHCVCELLSDLADIYPAMIAVGGKIVPSMQPFLQHNDHEVRQITIQLLQHIAIDTSQRLEYRLPILLCPDCLTRCTAHNIDVTLSKSITYYGCRLCGQSQEFLEWDGEVVAVLDNQMTANKDQENNLMRVNWLNCRVLFDFDRVEIISALDEDVERFAVQVGNDTDTTRKSRYKKMQCLVWQDCDLSENSMRVLRHTFGPVEIKDIVSLQM